ncbi:MAG TPA: hypothetical protein VJZ91_18560, partial [Blastocatellia bacterium]|nr:hypothetical protein [Blastocatellia bacterium]
MNGSHHRTSDQAASRSGAAWKHALRATFVALALLACYVGIRSTTAAHETGTAEPSAAVAAQDAITGEWIIESKSSSDSLYLTVQRGGNGNGRHFHSTSS